jgi:hypothetical protein
MEGMPWDILKINLTSISTVMIFGSGYRPFNHNGVNNGRNFGHGEKSTAWIG